MVSKKVTPKTSSATSLAASSGTSKLVYHSILKSSFAPSRLQLSLFASVIQSLDSHQLRVHDTVSGRLKAEHSALRTRINCISWGHYRSSQRDAEAQPTKRKKKQHSDQNGSDRGRGVAVIAVGTNNESIDLFSPLDSKIVGVLSPAHPHGTRDIKFKDNGADHEAWSLGADSTLIQWNLMTNERVRTIPAAAEALHTLALGNDTILVASQNAFLIDPDSEQIKATFYGKDPIHGLLVPPHTDVHPGVSPLLAAAQGSRSINVYDIQSASLIGNLVADSDVEAIVLQDETRDQVQVHLDPILAAVTKDGTVNVFNAPFEGWKPTKSKKGDLKTRFKQLTRKPEASTRVTRPDNAATVVPILNVSFQHPDLVLALADGSTELAFERLSLRGDSGQLSLPPSIVRTKTKGLAFGAGDTNGVKDLRSTHLNESQSIVAQGAELSDEDAINGEQGIIEISSAEDESEESDESDEEEEPLTSEIRPITNGTAKEDVEMADAPEGILEQEEEEEQSFGDLLRARSIGTVDVSAALPGANEKSLVPAIDKADVSTNLSLGTVLSQALRTNDVGLLETCLRVQDLQIVRATIERLGSDLAITLLKRLAERLHDRPGRAGSLLVWVQWTLVAHGGYLSARPDAVKKLSSLHAVVQERAKSLQPLLSLKGKLDMLEAQINLRKNLRQQRDSSIDGVKGRGPVIYVENQEESSSESEEERLPAIESMDSGQHFNHIEDKPEESSEEEDELADAVNVNGSNDVHGDSEGEDSIDEDESESSTSQDEDSDDNVDYDDVDSAEENRQDRPSSASQTQQKAFSGNKKWKK